MPAAVAAATAAAVAAAAVVLKGQAAAAVAAAVLMGLAVALAGCKSHVRWIRYVCVYVCTCLCVRVCVGVGGWMGGGALLSDSGSPPGGSYNKGKHATMNAGFTPSFVWGSVFLDSLKRHPWYARHPPHPCWQLLHCNSVTL